MTSSTSARGREPDDLGPSRLHDRGETLVEHPAVVLGARLTRRHVLGVETARPRGRRRILPVFDQSGVLDAGIRETLLAGPLQELQDLVTERGPVRRLHGARLQIAPLREPALAGLARPLQLLSRIRRVVSQLQAGRRLLAVRAPTLDPPGLTAGEIRSRRGHAKKRHRDPHGRELHPRVGHEVVVHVRSPERRGLLYPRPTHREVVPCVSCS